MPRRSSDYAEGVVDVGIIVPVCFENPLKEVAVDFLSAVLTQEVPAKIPVSAVLGAYHIATRYLRASREAVREVLSSFLRTYSPAFFSDISPYLALEALRYATEFHIESWDGYLVALALLLGTTTIYSLDRELGKVPGIEVVNPFPEDKVREYHHYVSMLMRNPPGRR